jgi:hypothetical protein
MVNLFDNLCKLACKDKSLGELSLYSLRSKTLTLELIQYMLESPKSMFTQNIKILYLLKG